MRRLAVFAVLTALVAAGPASDVAPAQTSPPGLGELWERYPLQDDGAAPPTSTTDAATAPPATTVPRPVDVSPSASVTDPGGGREWIPLVVLIVSLLLLGAMIVDHVRSRRRPAAAVTVGLTGPAVPPVVDRPDPPAAGPAPRPARADDPEELLERASRAQPGRAPRGSRRAPAADPSPTGERAGPSHSGGVLPAARDPRLRP